MDPETREFLEQQFAAIDQRFTRVESEFRSEFRGVRQDVAEQLAETKRHVGVVVEGLRSEIRQVAEGVMNVDEKLERFRHDVDEQFTEVKTLVKVSYGDRDRRVRILEGEA